MARRWDSAERVARRVVKRGFGAGAGAWSVIFLVGLLGGVFGLIWMGREREGGCWGVGVCLVDLGFGAGGEGGGWGMRGGGR